MPGFSSTGSDPTGSLPSIANTTPAPGGDPVPFTRSAARTIKVGAAARAFTAPTPGYWDMTNPKKPRGIKDPNATLDFTFDWSEWLSDLGSALIGAIEWLPGGGAQIVANPPADEGKFATVVLAAGTGGEVPLTCRITTDTVPPLVEDRTVYLTIEDR